ncbi:CoA-binding protein [Agrobacterium tumefaciens str. Cherry 2E-2-2]|nr:CoA-binding protein [Agrobacterium tumefaciens str. Cherry 2E-2-2]
MLDTSQAIQSVKDLQEAGTKLAVVLTSATGNINGSLFHTELLTAAGNMRLLGPNSIGVIDVHRRFALSASGALEHHEFLPGGISLISQSGGILGAFLSRATAQGVGLAKLVATGSEIDLDTADLIEFLTHDPDTKVIAVYAESLRSPERFKAAVAVALAAEKPVVMLKVGRSEVGARAAISHTGAIAGEDKVCNAFLSQYGIIRADTLQNLLDISAMLVSPRRLKGRRIGILTSSGGAGTLVADECGVAELDVPDLDKETATDLAKLLNTASQFVANPTDVTLEGINPLTMCNAAAILMKSDHIDCVAVVIGSSALIDPDAAVNSICAATEESDKPVVAYVSPHAPHITRDLNMRGVPAFTAAESCACALRAALNRDRRRHIHNRTVVPAQSLPIDLRSGALNEFEALDLVSSFGIPAVRRRLVKNGLEAETAAAELGDQVVLKAVSSALPHKAQRGGVRLGLTTNSVAGALAEMKEALAGFEDFQVEAFMIQEQVSGRPEFLIGVRQDPVFGPILVLALGGTFAELLDDSSIRCLPVCRQDALAMIDELRAIQVLKKCGWAIPYDFDALADAIVNIGTAAESFGEKLVEAEINPLFLMPRGQGVVAADALAVMDGRKE